MRRIPDWLKRPVLPLWNGGHRLAWRIGEYLDAFRTGRIERCIVCGRVGPMLYRRRVIPPRLADLWGLTPALAEALARKETCACFACGAKLRARRLARVLLDLFPIHSTPIHARSVREWARSPVAQGLRVAEINRIDGLHDQLARLPGLSYSDFGEEAPERSTAPRPPSEDLTRLTYPDRAFDLVLTSETLEHVPDLDQALGELHRVLKPGGWHLFTVPWLPNVPRTYARGRVRPDGSFEALAPPIRHPGGDSGYLVFTEFGADLPERIDAAGFDTTVWFGPPSEHDLGQVLASRRRPLTS